MMRRENKRMLGGLMMLRHFFLAQWDERGRVALAEQKELSNLLTMQPEQIYKPFEASGAVLQEYASKIYHLKFVGVRSEDLR